VTSLAVVDAAVFTSDDAGTIHPRGWIEVDDDRIVAIGSGDAPAAARRADVVIDAEGGAVMPGMVNGHTHLFQTLFRGLGDDKALLDWLRDYIWPAAAVMEPDELAAAAAVGILENLRSGVTTVIDHQYIHPGEHFDEAVCEEAERLGVRLLLARGWADHNYVPRLTEPGDVVLERTRTLAQRWHERADGRIRIETGPLIPWGCSASATQRLLAASPSGGLHTHCAETAVEVDMTLGSDGMRHVEWLHALGALNPRTQLAHSIWLDDHELDLIATHGAVVVHCPVSNMYLASGVARVPEMLRRGITVALASDGPGSNNRQDLFEAMKVAVLLQKVHHLDPVILQPEDVLTMATRGGAAAAGIPDDIGVLEAGRLADLVVVDLRSVFVAPVHRLASALVFNVTPRDVTHVVVGGRPVISDRQVLVADERAELARAEAARRTLFRRAGLIDD
jgi:5-methylthioadenosine/S-adenosylhomocysteine deaminase